MANRPDPIQIAAPPYEGESHQQHGKKDAQVEHRGQRQRGTARWDDALLSRARRRLCHVSVDTAGRHCHVSRARLPGRRLNGLSEHGGRRKEDSYLHLENQKQQRDHIKPQIKLNRPRPYSRLAAFVCLQLLDRRRIARKNLPKSREAKTNANPAVANKAK